MTKVSQDYLTHLSFKKNTKERKLVLLSRKTFWRQDNKGIINVDFGARLIGF